MAEVQPNLAKLEEMTHYIISKCQTKPSFGKTVLFKLLYFSDFNHYKNNFQGISNEQYKKIEFGPAPMHFSNVLKKLYDEGKIDYEEGAPSNAGWIFKSITAPKISYLHKDEIATIDRVIEKLGNLTANQISELSHEDNPYKSSKLKEVISYGLVFYRSEAIEKRVE